MLIKRIRRLFCCLCIILTVPGCFVPSRYLMRKNLFIGQDKASTFATPEEHNYKIRTPVITVWVHGTRLFQRSLYKKHVPLRLGLHHVNTMDHSYKLHTIARTLIEADHQRFDPEHFYMFIWSGKLCFHEREEAAKSLYIELERLLHTYKNKGLDPAIRIICHSHGGNVALNLAHVKHTFDVDELILLACPVQNKNKHLITHPMFKNIYAFYSTLDILQVLDPQGMYKHNNKATPLFSKRQFLHQENLSQLKIKIDRRAITHSEFAQTHFLSMLPDILDAVSQWHKTIIYREDPNKMSKLLCVYTNQPSNCAHKPLATI